MKKIFNFIMLATATLLSACSSDEDIIENDTVCGRETIIGVAMPDGVDTRLGIDDLSLSWEEGDQLLVVPVDENHQATAEGQIFTLFEGAGTNAASFKGFLPEAPQYVMYYKAANLYYDSVNKTYDIDYSSMTQNGINNYDHLKDYLLLCGDLYRETLTSSTISVSNAFLRIDVRSLPEALTSVKTLTFVINAGTPLEQISLEPIAFNGEIKNLTSDTEHNYIYMPMSFEPLSNNVNPSGNKMTLMFEGNTTAVVSAVATAKIQFNFGRYDMTVTTDASAQKTFNQWNISGSQKPAVNEIWVKFAEGTTKIKSLWDCYDNKFTLSDAPNASGWYVYSTASEITDDSGEELFNSDKVGANTIAEAWLPASMNAVPINMFRGCESLTNVILSPNTTDLKGSCFDGCTSLKNLVIPATVTTIGDNAFGYFSEKVPDNRLTVLAHHDTLTNYNTWFVFSGASTGNCDLYIHESWKPHINGTNWMDKNFRSVHFINDKGEEVTL